MKGFSLDFESFKSDRSGDRKTGTANIGHAFLQLFFADLPKIGHTKVQVNI